jgi:hypothetical protein
MKRRTSIRALAKSLYGSVPYGGVICPTGVRFTSVALLKPPTETGSWYQIDINLSLITVSILLIRRFMKHSNALKSPLKYHTAFLDRVLGNVCYRSDMNEKYLCASGTVSNGERSVINHKHLIQM